MPQFRQKNTPTIEALILPTGDYVVIKAGAPITIPKAQFEAEFEPVPGK
jgi:hypothetical protein